MTTKRVSVVVFAALTACVLASPAPAVAQCDQVDAPDCTCFNDLGIWDAGGPGALPGTIFIQDVAMDTLGVIESCPCPGEPFCDWDTDPADPDDDFENGGKPYYQIVLGYNTEPGALFAAELLEMIPGIDFPSREAWCSETVSYWHRESATPYLRGYSTDWHPQWRISNVADLRIWYETEEGAGGQGRWIDATEISYEDFEPGVNAPVPGAYIAIAEYDDAANAYPNMTWSHSIIVDEMTVHRDAYGHVFRVEIDILEGNSGRRVRDDHHWDDLISLTPLRSGWVSEWDGPDGVAGTADDIRRKVYGIGIDLDRFGQPYYDPARLHEEDHPEVMPAVMASPVTTSDDDWDGYVVFLPSLILYAEMLKQDGGPTIKWGLSQGNPVPVPDGDPLNALYIPAGFVGGIYLDLKGAHPLPIEGLELTWEGGIVPAGYTVEFFTDGQQSGSAVVPDLTNHIPPAGLPVLVPVVMDTAMTGVRSVSLFFPENSVSTDVILSEISVRFEGAPWEDGASESLDVQRPVFVDVKPGSCPNSVNSRARGVVPMAILGTFDLDVASIDPASVMAAGTVAPLRWSYEDVGTPYVGTAGGCHELMGDGIIDLTLKYDAKELAEALNLGAHAGENIPVMLRGVLLGDGGQTAILGEDWLRVLK